MERINSMLRASMRTARMSEKELLNYGFSQDQIDAGMHLPGVSGGVNSTQIITDLTTVQTNISSTQTTRAIAAAGPILDVNGCIALLILKAQEMKQLLNYLVGTGQTGGTTGGIFQNGDANAANGYTLLINVTNDLV